MAECIFCLIAKKSMKSRIVHEDKDTIAFLDITPRSKGMCLVIPKKHIENFTDDLELSKRVFESALIVSDKIQKALKPLTVFISVMQSQVPHINIRVYPVYEKQIPLIENNPINVSDAEMDDIAKKINAQPVVKKGKVEDEEKVEEKKVEEKPKIEKRDDFWHKRFEVA